MNNNISYSNAYSEKEIVAHAKAGDTVALSLLIERYSDIILKKANSFTNLSGIDAEDLYQEGMIGFVSSVYSYDEAYNTKFSTYASVVFTRKMLSAIRMANNDADSFTDMFVSLDDNDISSFNPSPEDTFLYSEELSEIIEFSKTNFSKTEKKVFKLMLFGASNSEISAILDCNIKSVENAVHRIRKKLRSRS